MFEHEVNHHNKYNMKKIKQISTQLIMALILNITVHAQIMEEKVLDSIPEFHLDGDSCVIPFIEDPRYIFIEGSIGKIKGKFMFDTGARHSLAINSLYTNLSGGKKNGAGFNGSGEHFDVYNLDTIRDIQIGKQLLFPLVGPVSLHEQKGIQENLMPDFLGLIGYDFFKGYLIEVDYKNRRIAFYKNTIKRKESQDFLIGEKVITVLDLKASLLPNHPLTDVKINGTMLEAGFDTGTPGVLYPTEDFKKEISGKGILSGKNIEQEARLNDIEFSNGYKSFSTQIHVLSPNEGAGIRRVIGFKTENILSLGHGFLSQYKTIWDFEGKKLYLLER